MLRNYFLEMHTDVFEVKFMTFEIVFKILKQK